MNERRVRSVGRPVYGRAVPLRRPGRPRRRWWPSPSLWQRRFGLLAALVLVAAWALSRLFAVTSIEVRADGRVGDIKAEVRKIVDGSWQQGNLLTLDSGDVASKLQQADPLLLRVEVRRRWPHGVVVTAALKQPSLGWVTGDQRYLLDRDGTVIGSLPSGSLLPVVADGSNLPVAIGQRVAGARFVAFVTQLAPALKAAGVDVTGLSVHETTLDLTVATAKGYRLIFDTGRSVGDEVADLKSVQALLVSQKKVPAEYIDLRIAGKAYYK